INDHSRRRVTQQVHLRGQLEYEGLAFLGEVWLDDQVRLGPPSIQFDRTVLNAPRVIIVDAIIDIIARQDAPWRFEQLRQELAAFLSVVAFTVRAQKEGRKAWTWVSDSMGKISDCSVRGLGYWESNYPQDMPARDLVPPVPLHPVTRPDFERRGYV